MMMIYDVISFILANVIHDGDISFAVEDSDLRVREESGPFQDKSLGMHCFDELSVNL